MGCCIWSPLCCTWSRLHDPATLVCAVGPAPSASVPDCIAPCWTLTPEEKGAWEKGSERAEAARLPVNLLRRDMLVSWCPPSAGR